MLLAICVAAHPASAQEAGQGFDGRPPWTRHGIAWSAGRAEVVRAMGQPDARPSLTVYFYEVGDGQVVFSFRHGGVESVAEIFAEPTQDERAARSAYDAYAQAIGWHYGLPVSTDVPVSGTLGTTNIQTTWRPLDERPDGVRLVELTLRAVPVDADDGGPPHYAVVVRYRGPEPPRSSDD